MDDGDLGGAQAVMQAIGAELVHQEADGAAMHAVDRLARSHERVQRLQHEAVAAECDNDIGALGRDIAVYPTKQRQRRLRFVDGTCDERNALVALGGGAHGPWSLGSVASSGWE